ncbi:hypothetical protein EJ110_NYTH04203 [Nymphaea thermarum]|nr:hypothetical protein EJ110_NYTH04203 [Nymphaea thermarum]
MGQVLACIQDKLHGKQWRHQQLRKITDRVFDRVKTDAGREHLTFEELFIAVLFVYNDINKHIPGPHIDPPPKEKVKTMMEVCDFNLDGVLDREEFYQFIKKLTADTLDIVSRNLIIALVLAPTVAILTKRATEGVPGVGKVVQKLPNSVYASLIALGVLVLENVAEAST